MTGKTNFKEMDLNKTYAREALLLSINEKTAKNRKPFVELELSDGNSIITARKFDTTLNDLKCDGVETENVVTVSIKASTYNGDRSYTVDDIYPSDFAAITLDDYIIKADIDFKKTWNQLICNIRCSHTPSERDKTYEPLSNLTLRLLNSEKDKFMHSAAGKSIHHNVIGGLLQHTAAMVQQAMYVAINYPTLDRELLVCGAALHDIGKLQELKTSRIGNVEYSADGRLLGHALIGVMWVEETAMNWPGEYLLCDCDRVTLLEHMIASHHGSLEFGAITEPAIPEAAVLHALDMIDSRVYIFDKAYKDMDPGEISRNLFALNNSVYKPLMEQVGDDVLVASINDELEDIEPF